jgi:hypothetical protein
MFPENRKKRGLRGAVVACKLKGLSEARTPSGRSRLSRTQVISMGNERSAPSALTSATTASMSPGEPDAPWGGVQRGADASAASDASATEGETSPPVGSLSHAPASNPTATPTTETRRPVPRRAISDPPWRVPRFSGSRRF